MNLVESLLGYRSFSSESEIRYSVEQSRYYDSSKGRRKNNFRFSFTLGSMV